MKKILLLLEQTRETGDTFLHVNHDKDVVQPATCHHLLPSKRKTSNGFMSSMEVPFMSSMGSSKIALSKDFDSRVFSKKCQKSIALATQTMRENEKRKKQNKEKWNERTNFELAATDRDQRQAFQRQDRDPVRGHRLALHWSVLLLRSVPSNLVYSCGTPFSP